MKVAYKWTNIFRWWELFLEVLGSCFKEECC